MIIQVKLFTENRKFLIEHLPHLKVSYLEHHTMPSP